jgi:oxalate decarboxylase/phosphoglucose isomerase-like protein (cupin superfamily)
MIPPVLGTLKDRSASTEAEMRHDYVHRAPISIKFDGSTNVPTKVSSVVFVTPGAQRDENVS